MQNTKTPFFINCAAVAVNTVINLPMYWWLGVKGLAAGHAFAYTVGAIIQGRVLSQRIGGLDGARIAASASRIASAGLAMGLVTWGGAELSDALLGDGAAAQLIGLAIPLTLGALSYLAFAQLFGVEELALVKSLVTRRDRSADV
jgi:peptidoglycan biosynthesis protein MviN/MurJ (putative lipid II flippase)